MPFATDGDGVDCCAIKLTQPRATQANTRAIAAARLGNGSARNTTVAPWARGQRRCLAFAIAGTVATALRGAKRRLRLKGITARVDERAMRCRTSVAIGVLSLLAAACGKPAAEGHALAAFGAFQSALFAGDVTALRAAVTEESAPAVENLPFAAIRQRQPLVANEAVDLRGSWLIRATDPNQGNAPADYFVTRERGRFVVDLIATAQLHATERAATSDGPRTFVPRELTPEDHDEIRRRELATPPGTPVR